MALIALSAGVGEEMLFRGVLQSSLAAWLGLGWGLASRACSSACCIRSRFPTFRHDRLGFYLGGAFLLTGNLLTVMVTHALYDLP